MISMCIKGDESYKMNLILTLILRHPKQYAQRSLISRPGSRWQMDSNRLSRLAMNSEFETDSSLSYNYSSSIIKLKIAIRVKPAPQEFSVRSGLPGVAPMIKPAELEVYVESAKNIPLVNEKPPSTYVRASVHHPKYGLVYYYSYDMIIMILIWYFRRKTGKTERIRNDSNPIWRQTIVYDRIKLIELEEATLTLSIVHRHRARKKLLGK